MRFLLTLLVAFSFQNHALAEDDLLSILEGGSETPSVNRDDTFIQKIRAKIGRVTPEQSIFLEFLKKGEMEKALYQWESAFKKTSFSKSATGKALYGYVLFQNKLHIIGIETLFGVGRPKNIIPELGSLWREVAPVEHPAWGFVNIQWKSGWTKVFSIATEVRVLGRNIYNLKNLDPIIALLKKTALNTSERAWLEWQLVLGLALNDDIAKSAKILKHLMGVKNNKVDLNHMNITAARLLFQKGFLSPAISYYKKITKGSDFWLEAQEEIGWSYLRRGEPQNTLSFTQTLMNSVFANELGPEPVFLHGLALLKVCDYPGVMQTLKTFRGRFRPKIKELQKLASTGQTEHSDILIKKMKEKRIKTVDLGKSATFLPRLSSRDEILFDLVGTQKALKKEAQLADALYARSLVGGTAKVGFQAAMKNLKSAVDSRYQAAQSASYARIKLLAKNELAEIRQVLQRMHIVEAEVIQQVAMASDVVAATKGRKNTLKAEDKKDDKNKLKFKLEKEIWFDELSNYKVSLKKGCVSSERSVE